MTPENQDPKSPQKKEETKVGDITPQKDVTGGKGSKKNSKQSNLGGNSGGAGKSGYGSQKLN